MTTAREDTTRLAELLRREHHALGEFLIALSAFDRGRRWSELGYSGLFSFLTRELRLSNGAAQNRKTAVELIQRFPRIADALRSGDLCLSSINEVARVITPENADELLPRFYGKSARDAAFVAAAIRPVVNPPERFVVTLLQGTDTRAQPVAAGGTLQLHAYEVPSRQEVRPTTTAPIAMSPPNTTTPLVAPAARPTIKPLDAERARMNITVSRRLLEKLARARDVLSHSHPRASEETILELGLDLVIQRYEKRRGIGAKPRNRAAVSSAVASDPGVTPVEAAPVEAAGGARSRHVPAAVWRAVWARDGGRCAYPLDGGGVCGSTTRVQLDHVDGFALGGETTLERCRLLCAVHQDVHARTLYGDDLMDRYTRSKGPRCSEPVAGYRTSAGPSERGRSAGPPVSRRAASSPPRSPRLADMTCPSAPRGTRRGDVGDPARQRPRAARPRGREDRGGSPPARRGPSSGCPRASTSRPRR